MKVASFLATACLALPLFTQAADIPLAQPTTVGGKPLMQTLALRKTDRDFSARPLTPAVLSSLLWAANGINRPDGRRTAPTGLNVQDIDIYVILPDGIYKYAAEQNVLRGIRKGDYRKAAGVQPFVHVAPVNLVYVQNLDKSMKGDDATKARHGGIHTGAIMQNVYLFCASANMITVARDYVDRAALSPLLGLTPSQRIILTQTVGYSGDQVAVPKPAPTPATAPKLGVVPPPPAPAPKASASPQPAAPKPPKAPAFISMDAAKRIAMDHARVPENAARKVKCELKRKHDRTYYEVEFECQGFEYEYDINAVTGAILKSERERD